MFDQEDPVISLPPLEPAAETSPQVDTAARLGLMIGDQRWLVDLSEAGEIVPVPDSIARVPLTREWLLGLVNLRGALYTVVDLQAYARLGRTDGGKDARLLALASRLNFNASIMVTRMMGLRNVSSMRSDDTDLAYAPFGSAGQPEWVGNALLDADGNRWYELDLAKLAAGSDFLLVGR